MKHFAIVVLLALFTISCSKDDNPDPQNFENIFSFEINGQAYSFSDFEITHDTIVNGPRVFVRKDDGNNRFTFNFLLDKGVGTHGLNWNDGSDFFFSRNELGDFFTLDPDKCTVVKEVVDLGQKQIKATFEGVGEQGLGDNTVSIANGLIQVQY